MYCILVALYFIATLHYKRKTIAIFCGKHCGLYPIAKAKGFTPLSGKRITIICNLYRLTYICRHEPWLTVTHNSAYITELFTAEHLRLVVFQYSIFLHLELFF
jgi:hypothetical protein